MREKIRFWAVFLFRKIGIRLLLGLAIFFVIFLLITLVTCDPACRCVLMSGCWRG